MKLSFFSLGAPKPSNVRMAVQRRWLNHIKAIDSPGYQPANVSQRDFSNFRDLVGKNADLQMYSCKTLARMHLVLSKMPEVYSLFAGRINSQLGNTSTVRISGFACIVTAPNTTTLSQRAVENLVALQLVSELQNRWRPMISEYKKAFDKRTKLNDLYEYPFTTYTMLNRTDNRPTYVQEFERCLLNILVGGWSLAKLAKSSRIGSERADVISDYLERIRTDIAANVAKLA